MEEDVRRVSQTVRQGGGLVELTEGWTKWAFPRPQSALFLGEDGVDARGEIRIRRYGGRR